MDRAIEWIPSRSLRKLGNWMRYCEIIVGYGCLYFIVDGKELSGTAT